MTSAGHDVTRKKRTAILAEDTMVQRLAIAAMLENQGFEVSVAEDGVEALKIMESAQDGMDIVIADIGMPRMNGINLCRNIKKNPRIKHVPVVMLTTLDDGRNRTHAREAGASAFLVKPVTEQQLLSCIETVLSPDIREEETGEAHSWYREVFEALPDAVVVTDADDRCIDANLAAYALLDRSRDELLQLDSEALYSQSSDWIRSYRLRLKEGRAWRERVRLKSKQGGAILVEAHATSTSFDGARVHLTVFRTLL